MNLNLLAGLSNKRRTFDMIKEYMSTSPVLHAQRREASFKLYIAAKEKIISAILIQEDDGKEYVIISGRRLLDPKIMPILKVMFVIVLCLW
jgi:hypothetical protein